MSGSLIPDMLAISLLVVALFISIRAFYLYGQSLSPRLFAIFFNYMWAFMTKQTRFSGLMSLSFLLLSFGYLVILQKYIATDQTLLDNIGDIVRMGGLVALLAAVVKG